MAGFGGLLREARGRWCRRLVGWWGSVMEMGMMGWWWPWRVETECGIEWTLWNEWLRSRSHEI